MNSIKCRQCNVVNWSSQKQCIRCKAPLIGTTSLPLNDAGSDYQRSSSQPVSLRSLQSNQVAVAAGVILLVIGLVYLVTKPSKEKLDIGDNSPIDFVQQRAVLAGGNAPWSFDSSRTPETFGVSPFADIAGAEKFIKVSSQSVMVESGSTSTVVAKGGTPGTSSYWENTAVQPDYTQKTLCTGVVHSKIFKDLVYEKYEDTVYAVVVFYVDGECGNLMPRATYEQSIRYQWTGNGFGQWKFCDHACFASKQEELRKIEEKAAADGEAAKRARRLETEQKAKQRSKIEHELKQFEQD